MKLFLDTADRKAIEKWSKTGIIDGVTTNPSHLSKEGSNPQQVVKDICQMLPHGDISVEITETTQKSVYEQAHAIAKIATNVVVKIPCHVDYYEIINQLVKDGIKINVTLVFTLIQSTFMAKLGVKYISPFVGRWDDIDVEGGELLFEIRSMFDRYNYQTELLAASLRGVRHLHTAILAGADAVTLPIDVLEKTMSHPLTNQGMDKFLTDWQKLGIKQFPQ
jgi:transaldolase